MAGLPGSKVPLAGMVGVLMVIGFQHASAQTTPLSLAPADAVTLQPVEVQGRSAAPSTDPLAGFVAPTARSGSKTDTPLRETPQSISVVTRDEIDARQAESVGAALRYVPGIRVEPYGPDTRYDWFTLRGFEAGSNAIFLNGLHYQLGNMVGVVEPYGLERIEVVRGPSSVLYGQIGPGGLVNLVSRHPTQDAQGEVRLSADSTGSSQAAFTTGGRLTDDGKWSYNLTGLGRLGGTQVDSVKNDRTYLAPSITWQPDADTKMTLLSYYQRDLTQGDEFLPALGTLSASAYGRISTNRFTGNTNGDHFNRTQFGFGWEAEHRLNDNFTLRQNMRFASADYNWQQAYGVGLVPGTNGARLYRYPFQQKNSLNTVQIDNQGEARFATGPLDHTLLAGVDYAHSDYGSTFAAAPIDSVALYGVGTTTPAPSKFTLSSSSTQASDQVGLYLQDQIHFAERFVLSTGLRQDIVETSTTDRISGGRSAQDDSKLTWRTGLVYLADNGLAPYASYSTSFQPQIGTGFYGQTFKPTTGEQYEAGVKYQPVGHRSFLQASVFQLAQQNVLTTDPQNTLNQVQTGEIRVRGAELEGVASLSDGLDVRAAFTYLDAITTRSSNPGEQGKRPNGIPATTASTYAQYSFQEDAGRLAGLGIGAGVRFTGNTPVGNTHLAIVPNVMLFDASLRYDLKYLHLANRNFDRTSLQLNASNIFDKQYVASCGSLSSCFYGLRRVITGSLVYRW